MFALLLSFVQTILYRSLSKEDAKQLKNTHTTTAPYHFFLVAMVIGNCLMIYPYLWLVGGFKAIALNLGIIFPSAMVMMYIIAGNIARVKRICMARSAPGPGSPSDSVSPDRSTTTTSLSTRT